MEENENKLTVQKQQLNAYLLLSFLCVLAWWQAKNRNFFNQIKRSSKSGIVQPIRRDFSWALEA